jgi:hypothetical protein
MSWDIVLFNSTEKITSPESLDENKLVPADFCSVIENSFKNIRRNDTHRSIEDDNFAIEYFYDDEPSSNMMLSLYGEQAIYPIIDLAISNNWQIYDTGIDGMIDLDNPSKNGYKNFTDYLKQILTK